jgi:hypothetical protein
MATMKAKRLSELTGEELAKLLALIGSSDSVELKITLPEHEQQATIAALGLDPLEAQIRQVYFFDTSELQLNRTGVAVRARRIQGRAGDTVVKLRPVVPDDLPEDIRRSASVNVEVDATPKGYAAADLELTRHDLREIDEAQFEAQGARYSEANHRMIDR